MIKISCDLAGGKRVLDCHSDHLHSNVIFRCVVTFNLGHTLINLHPTACWDVFTPVPSPPLEYAAAASTSKCFKKG